MVAEVYFAHPYTLWEQDLMRIPIVSISRENQVSRLALMISFCFFIKERLNDRPRQWLDFLLPMMGFLNHLQAALAT